MLPERRLNQWIDFFAFVFRLFHPFFLCRRMQMLFPTVRYLPCSSRGGRVQSSGCCVHPEARNNRTGRH